MSEGGVYDHVRALCDLLDVAPENPGQITIVVSAEHDGHVTVDLTRPEVAGGLRMAQRGDGGFSVDWFDE